MKRSLLILVGIAACVAPSRGPALDPRYVAVHNALAGSGLVQVGPIHQASLAEGRETRLAVELGAQCATIVALGSTGVRELDVSLLDADDKAVAQAHSAESEATVHACPGHSGHFTALVKVARGAGDVVVAAWAGNAPSGETATAIASSSAAGTCESPIPLTPGTTLGNTRRGEAENIGSCANSEAKELIYRLDVPRRQHVIIDVDPTFDSVLYVRKDDCNDKDAEVACNDDTAQGGNTSKRTSSTRGSRIDEILDPGPYWVFVDGYNNEGGSFRLSVQATDVPTLTEACQKARPIGQHVTGSLTNEIDHVDGSCEMKGPDAIHRLDVRQKARVRVVVHSDEFVPAIQVRRTCADEASELVCTDAGFKKEDAAYAALLDPGSYTVFADSTEKTAKGAYAIDVELAPEQGSGVRGDSCGDALPVVPNDHATDGDTFEAHDDIAGKCSGAGAADVLYRFDVPARSRVTGRFLAEEGEHVFVLAKSCTDRSTEIACGTTFDEVLAAGTYSLAVDGTTKSPFGRFSFALKARDVTLQEAACKNPPALMLGHSVSGTTIGAGDRFSESCAGREDAQASADRVFKLVLPTKQHVQLLLSTPTHDGVLAVRRACVDPPGAKTLRSMEVACNNDGPDNRHSKIDTTLEPGSYYVIVDGHQGKNEGAFTLEAKALR